MEAGRAAHPGAARGAAVLQGGSLEAGCALWPVAVRAAALDAAGLADGAAAALARTRLAVLEARGLRAH